MSTEIELEHHDGTSDATPGGYPEARRPGELVFALVMVVCSLVLLWNAYGISGFEALSAPGSVPMATTLVMAVTATMVLVRTAKLPRVRTETVARDILPRNVVAVVGLLVLYGLLLKPAGFLPTSAVFLILAIRLLSGKGWGYCIAISLFSLLLVWLVFRIVFSVLIPAGIVPEAEIIQIFRNLFHGAA